MATTALFVEIIIVGLQTLIWIVALIGLFPGVHVWDATIEWAGKLEKWAALVTVLVLATAYVLGILADRFADDLYRRLHRRLVAAGVVRKEKRPADMGIMRLAVMKESDGIAKFIDYQRSRVRIARATVLNLIVGLLIALGYARGVRGWWVIPAVLVGGLIAIVIALYATERIHKAHEDRLAEAYQMLRRLTIEDAVVAAICYRRGRGGTQFLLVRTKGGRSWTFPKGHIRKKERKAPWQAATREAEEEGGVRGDVRELPLGLYRYPAKAPRGIDRAEYRVAAFLLRVTRDGLDHERDRQPTWCTPDEARAKLAEGHREAIYAAEHQRVVDAALATVDA